MASNQTKTISTTSNVLAREIKTIMKLSLFFAGTTLLAMIFAACGREENMMVKMKTFQFAKITKMLNFENTLQNGLKYRQKSTDNTQTAKAESDTRIANEVKDFLFYWYYRD